MNFFLNSKWVFLSSSEFEVKDNFNLCLNPAGKSPKLIILPLKLPNSTSVSYKDFIKIFILDAFW